MEKEKKRDFEISSVASEEHIARSAIRYMWSEMLVREKVMVVNVHVFLFEVTFQELGS